MGGRRRGPPGARRAGPERGLGVAAGLDEGEIGGVVDRRGVDLEGLEHPLVGVDLVVEGEAGLAEAAADADGAAADGQRPSPARRAQAQADRRGPAERGPQPGEGLAVHVLVEQGQPMRVQRGVVVAAGQGGDAGLELRLQRREDRRAAGPAMAPARAVAQAGRVVERVGAGEARRPGGIDEAVVAEAVRAAKDPELGEPGEVAQLPGDRVDAGLLGHRPARVVEVGDEGQGAGPAVAQRGGELATGQAPRLRRRPRHPVP
jgi:hypothetical protein